MGGAGGSGPRVYPELQSHAASVWQVTIIRISWKCALYQICMEIFPESLIKTALPQPQLLWHSAQGTVRRARTSFCRTKSQPCLAKPRHLVMWASGSASRLLRGNHLQGTWGAEGRQIHTHAVFFLLLPLDIVASASRKYAMQCALRGTAIVLGDPPTLG